MYQNIHNQHLQLLCEVTMFCVMIGRLHTGYWCIKAANDIRNSLFSVKGQDLAQFERECILFQKFISYTCLSVRNEFMNWQNGTILELFIIIQHYLISPILSKPCPSWFTRHLAAHICVKKMPQCCVRIWSDGDFRVKYTLHHPPHTQVTRLNSVLAM